MILVQSLSVPAARATIAATIQTGCYVRDDNEEEILDGEDPAPAKAGTNHTHMDKSVGHEVSKSASNETSTPPERETLLEFVMFILNRNKVGCGYGANSEKTKRETAGDQSAYLPWEVSRR